MGPISTGKDRRWPNSSIERSRVAAPFSGRGSRSISAKAALVAPQRRLVLRPAIGEVEDRARQGLARQLAHGGEAVGAAMPLGRTGGGCVGGGHAGEYRDRRNDPSPNPLRP